MEMLLRECEQCCQTVGSRVNLLDMSSSLRSNTDYIVLNPPSLFHLKDTIISLSVIEVRVWLCLLCTKDGSKVFFNQRGFLIQNLSETD